MAHVGKPFEKLFPRDLSNWDGPTLLQAPKRLKMTLGTPINVFGVRWLAGTEISDEGTWDYSTGHFSWVLPATGPSTPGSHALFDYWLDLPRATGFHDLLIFDGATLIARQVNPVPWTYFQANTFIGGAGMVYLPGPTNFSYPFTNVVPNPWH